ncbi:MULTISPECIES: type II toxin-antitoxin system prevent-host-death family antitoxin [unclassified Streptomyces]|uniref:type II toxin-antitoxin system prevent-host-death family antitoxin n=1 Tax=unclassified Streptomyces TaxID=2593676 RepID=UPI0005A950F8|nr:MULTISPECIES: type II toxin-antitoxin system prevent-host-death family antitoxin [unclassified Streptomyces]ODA75376.1 hypothetical protein APS67_000537 [Streptomyces sp. AVP053U2]
MQFGPAAPVYGGERVVATRHGKPLVALVSADDLRRLDRLRELDEGREPVDEQVVGTVAGVHGTAASAPREQQRFGIAAEHRGTAAS